MNNTSIIVDKIIKSNKKKILYLWIVKNNTLEASKIINEFSNGEKYDIEEIFSEFQIAYSNEPDIIKANVIARETSNQPKCPYCQSTNLKKLDVIDRGVSFGLFGFASSKVGKQWHCNNCKSDF